MSDEIERDERDRRVNRFMSGWRYGAGGYHLTLPDDHDDPDFARGREAGVRAFRAARSRAVEEYGPPRPEEKP